MVISDCLSKKDLIVSKLFMNANNMIQHGHSGNKINPQR